jgi:Domain of unknown function (DUF397)
MEGTNRDVTRWRKSTYSADNNGNCVEVGGAGPAVVVRDTKDRAGAVLTFGADAWARFAATVKGADAA